MTEKNYATISILKSQKAKLDSIKARHGLVSYAQAMVIVLADQKKEYKKENKEKLDRLLYLECQFDAKKITPSQSKELKKTYDYFTELFEEIEE